MRHCAARILNVLMSVFLTCACACTGSGADPVVALAEFDTAVAAYEKGDFAISYGKFTKIAEDYVSPELCVNAGSAAYRAGNDGEAVLWFRRALVLDPRCTEARQNLRFLKRRLGFLRFDEAGLHREYGDFLSIPVWRFWFASFAGLASVCLASLVVFRVSPPVRNGLLCVSVSAVLLSGAFGIGWWVNMPDRQVLSLHVVVAPDAAALAAPNSSSGRIVALPPGSEIAFLERRGNWIYADLPGNSRGWIRSAQVAQLWPFSLRLVE
jgi:hypothetical protein